VKDEQCPKCGSLFPAQRAWAHRGYTLLGSRAIQDLDTRVKCPNCGHVFGATAYRFFGVVPPHAMRIGVTVFVVLILATGLYISLMP
jgi:uncharacterized C2H2 Zn-finger protein